ncbi:MAG TPA: hypothetical protein PLM75_09145, partial [bacterium]|nr:hypothetical protein [bacterium]
ELQMQQAMTEELMSEKMSTEDKSSFTINGFIEARYENMDIKKGGYSTNNQSGSLVSYKLWKNREVGQFSVRNLNMYFDFKYGQKLRAFSEIKFLEYPSGTTKILGDPTTTDDGNGSFISYGSIYIERAWVDYKFNDLFKMQFGKMLTPFGIWNVEHGAPILPSIRVPASISYGMVPNNFVGINLHGNTLLKNWEFEYNAFVSNGRGVWNVENNNNKGIGASVNFKVPTKFLNKLVFGGMYYTGKEILEQQQKYDVPYTDTTYISGNEYLSFYDTIKNSAKEYCYTFHLATGYKKLEINAEYVYNNIKYENYNGIDNLNNRLFYRPDNRSLVESASANFAALPAGLTAAMGTLGTFGNDSTLIQALTALTAAGVNDTAHPLYGVYYGVGALIQGFNGGAKTVADAKKTNTPEGVAAFINSYYGYAMPLVTLNPKRSGYYIMSRYLLTPKFYPYFTYEAADPGDNDPFPPVKVYIFGFNYKPMPVITFKIEHSWQKFKREPLVTGYTQSAIASTRVEDFNYLQMSVSYAF